MRNCTNQSSFVFWGHIWLRSLIQFNLRIFLHSLKLRHLPDSRQKLVCHQSNVPLQIDISPLPLEPWESLYRIGLANVMNNWDPAYFDPPFEILGLILLYEQHTWDPACSSASACSPPCPYLCCFAPPPRAQLSCLNSTCSCTAHSTLVIFAIFCPDYGALEAS